MPVASRGLPSIAMADGPHGVRRVRPDAFADVGPGTAFPTGTAMAATWNLELIHKTGRALGRETRERGFDVLLGPCVNIIRTPVAGRTFESFSEDPHLAGTIGSAWVDGLQSAGIGAALKHFACNNQERNRGYVDVLVDERALREIYLPAFERIVTESRPWTVMCAYNRVNGIHMCANRYLLNDVLRGEWGFDGVVMSDWGANHRSAESLLAGLDLEMPGPPRWYGELLLDMVHNLYAQVGDVDRAARRLCELVRKAEAGAGRKARVDANRHRSLAREVAGEAMVLLKNDRSVLPLDPSRLTTLAVLGPAAADVQISGGGSSRVEPASFVTPLEGITRALNGTVEILHEKGCDNRAWYEPVDVAHLKHPTTGEPGLKAEYFSDTSFRRPPTAVRTDSFSDLFFEWIPLPEGIDAGAGFAVRWTATFVAPFTGPAVFGISHTGRSRLVLDGRQVLSCRAEAPRGTEPLYAEASYRTRLRKGKTYRLVWEFIRPAAHPIGHARLLFGPPLDTSPEPTLKRALSVARKADAVVVVAGFPADFETEGNDHRTNLSLTGFQDRLIETVADANRNTVVVLNTGGPISMPWIEHVPAVLQAWYAGQEMGAALADILFGTTNPSGKLPMSFPARIEDTTAYTNYPGTRHQVRYGEGIFVGYRGYDMRRTEVLFPFGHGLSYTHFTYRNVSAKVTSASGKSNSRKRQVTLTVTVSNAGTCGGAEVVQVYVRDCRCSVARPVKELKAFRKLTLEAGQSAELSFELGGRDFMFFDPHRRQWTFEPGAFELLVGSSSRDIRKITGVELM